MKLILCHKCQTMVTARQPTDSGLPQFNQCPCKACAIAYTGDDNMVAISGPGTVVGIDEASWTTMLTTGAHMRFMPTVVTFKRNGTSTVIDLDAPENDESRAAEARATHLRKSDGAYFELLEDHGDCMTIQDVITQRPFTIDYDVFRISYKER